MMKTVEAINNKESQEGEALKKQLLKYFRYWPLFLFFVGVFLVGAYLYLRYATPVYKTSTRVKILDKDENGIDLSGLSNSTTLFNYSKIKLSNEIQVFKSRRLLEQVVDKLSLRSSYYRVNNFTEDLLFQGNLPFQVIILNETEESLGSFVIKFKKDRKFTISSVNSEKSSLYHLGDTIVKFGQAFQLVENSQIGNRKMEGEYLYNHAAKDLKINYLAGNIDVNPVGENSDILSASMMGSNKDRNEAILNTLVDVFNKDGIEDKRLISINTRDFVEERLRFLEKELDTVESGLVNFKENNEIVTVESSVAQLLGNETASDAEKFNVATKIAVAQQFQDLLAAQDDFKLLPVNLGISSGEVNSLTSEFNELVLERNRLLVSSTEENPVIININQKLSQIRTNILSNLSNHLKSLEITYNRLTKRTGDYEGQINNLPQKEKDIRSIMRQQGIKERLYVFLLQKREEANLSYAITSPMIKVVDYAYTQPSPVEPQPRLIYGGAVALGMLIPFGILYGMFALNTSLNNRDELEVALPEISVLGEVPQIGKTGDKLIAKKDQGVLAESFRILRTNLLHFFKLNYLEGSESKKVVFVTSSIKGEGKTFTAVNLSRTLASSGKKVLLVGGDLRNPQLHQYFDGKGKDYKGVSNYLVDPTLAIETLIVTSFTEFKGLDVLFSGSVPPNPAELLMDRHFENLIENLKANYDYVIVDTAPTIYVTDTFLMANTADVTVYMTKQGVTDKKLFNHIKKIKTGEKLKNLTIVFNGVSGGTNFGYGYGYIYDNEVKKKPWKFWA